MVTVKKAIIPAAGLGTRFLPLSKVLAKELLPLGDVPLIEYSVKEAKSSEISQIIFVLSEKKKAILDYFKKAPKLENILKSRKQHDFLKKLKRIENNFSGLSFSFTLQEKPLGDGDAVLTARKLVRQQPCAVLFPDDLIEGKKPAIGQLLAIFKTCQKPVIGLKRIAKEKLSSYGVVAVEKIANRLYKIKDIVEKPKEGEAPSDFAIAGRYILTPEVFDYLKKTPANEKGEIILAEAFKLMLCQGKLVYGCELEGEWLACGNKMDWLRSNLYLTLQHPEYGHGIKEWLKKIK